MPAHSEGGQCRSGRFFLLNKPFSSITAANKAAALISIVLMLLQFNTPTVEGKTLSRTPVQLRRMVFTLHFQQKTFKTFRVEISVALLRLWFNANFRRRALRIGATKCGGPECRNLLQEVLYHHAAGVSGKPLFVHH